MGDGREATERQGTDRERAVVREDFPGAAGELRRPGEGPTGGLPAERAWGTGEPDVLLEVPHVKVEEIDLEVDDLRARVSLSAALANLVSLDVGADVGIDRVKLTIKGVDAEAILKVRLEKVYAILERALATLDRNPQLLAALLRPVEGAVGAAGRTLDRTLAPVGEAVGEAAGRALSPVGEAVGEAGRALSPMGEVVGGAGRTLGPSPDASDPDRPARVAGRALAPSPDAADADRSAPAAGPGLFPSPDAAAPDRPAARAAHPGARLTPAVATLALLDGADAGRWRHVGDGSFAVADGELRLDAGTDPGLAYFAGRRFDDFVVRFRFRPEPGALFGLAVRFRDPAEPVPDREDSSRRYGYDNPAYVAMHTGFEVQLGSDRPAIEPGTWREILFGASPGTQAHPARADLEPEAWSEVEVAVEGDEYRVWLDGRETARFTNVDRFRGRPASADASSGYLGFVLRRGRATARGFELVELRPGPEWEAEGRPSTAVVP